ncbi:MAG: T9SS type A sorting domain-containing protein, partial [Flavobacteriales bacterium]|nr:T9SS type A sorting domain-containing protein [Flavobacteriales bacterium]
GMVNDSVFDPTILGPGPSLITYTYTNTQGCSDNGIRIANTVQTPPLILSSNLPSFCEGDGPYSLGATVNPSGGNYSGPGVSGTTFSPVNAGVGTHLIRYKYSVAQNCEDSVDFYLVVNASPTINYPDYDSLCENISSTPLFSANPFGGTYSGPFVIGNNFYPFFSGAGSFPITYTLTENGCTSSSTKNIQIDANVNAQLNNIADYCVNDTESILDFGFPTGGNYKIDGVSKDSLNPSELGIGTHTIEYELTNSCGTSVDTKTFEIFGLPNVSAGGDAAVCIGESVMLSGAGASSYAWNNSVTNATTFSPTSTLTYIMIGTDINGCTNTDSLQVTVNDLPNVDAGNDTSICDNQLITLTASGALTYIWDNNITNTTAFTPISTTSYTVTGTDINGCINTDQVTITVNSLPNVNAGQDIAVCMGDSVTLNGTGAFVYSWDNNITNAISFLPTVSKIYAVTGTDVNGCNASDNILVSVNTLPNVDAGTDASICIGSSVTLNGTGASSYIWNNSVTNATAFSPTSTFTYTVTGTDTDGCENSDSLQVTVNDLPIVNAGKDTSICDNESITLTASGALTYNWDNNINNATSFTPTSTTLYTVIGTDINGCINSDQVTITINNNPLVSLSSFTPICNANSSTVPLSGGVPTGGNYNGLGVLNNNFTPSVSGAGFHNITYTYIDTNGCSSSDNKILVVDTNNVNISLPTFGNLCEGEDSLVLNSGIPSGGFYSGNSVNNDVFYPENSGTGSFTITYSYLEANTCLASANSIITVSTLPNTTQDSLNPICLNNTPFVVNGGSPSGGIYSGNGITNGIFNPQITGIGNFNVNYTYTDSLGCVNSSATSIIVKPLPNTSLTSFNDLCIDANSLVLSNANPLGGTYSGNGVNNGIFYPDSSGIGNHLITYTGELNGCFLSDSQAITVNPLPLLSYNILPNLCVDDSLLLDFMIPSGGTYTGDAIINNTMYGNIANSLNNNFTYTLTDQNSCTNSITNSLVINSLTPITTSINYDDEFCINEPTSTLNNFIPLGGNYSGNGISNNSFNASLAGVGQQLINYEFTNSNGCKSTITDTIKVNSIPNVSITNISICENSDSIALVNGLPIGGTYSGNGINNEFFSPNNVNFGNSTLYYSFTDSNNCFNSDSSLITVNSIPSVSINLIDSICNNDIPIILNSGFPLGGIYSGNGVTGNIFDPSLANTLQPNVIYTYTDSNNCTGTALDSLKINIPTNVIITGDSNLCLGETINLLATGGIEFLWNSGDSINNINISPNNNELFLVQSIDSNGCNSYDSISVTVFDLPVVSIVSPDSICADSISTLLINNSFSSYLWSTNSTSSSIDIGPFNIGDLPSYSVVIEDSNGCSNNDSVNILVVECNSTEINEHNLDLNIYPNPNNGNFTIEINLQEKKNVYISMYSYNGKLVKQELLEDGITTFNYSDLSKGLYHLLIESKSTKISKKIVIQ